MTLDNILRSTSEKTIYFNTSKKDQSSLKYLCLVWKQVTLKEFVCVEVLRPGQSIKVTTSEVSLPNRTFPGQA